MTTVQFDEVDCEGSETNLTSCTAYRYNAGFCGDTPREAAGLTCTSESASEVDIRLAGGKGAHEGQMEFLVDGVWRKLCGEETTFQEANVFCQSLGYERSFALVQDGSAFLNSDDGDPFFDYLDCTGSEDKVTSCRMLRSKKGTCSSLYGAAAISCVTDDPVNIRLVGGQGSYEGRVEIFYDGSWGSVCASKPWSIATSALVCSLLGYHDKNYVTFFDDDRYGDLTDPVRFDKLDCKGVKTASSIKSCLLHKFSAGYCRSGYASVQCERAPTKPVPTSIQTTQATWAVATSLRQQAPTYPTTTPFIDAFEDSSPDIYGTDRQLTTLITVIDDVIDIYESNSTFNNRSFNRNMSEIHILLSPNQSVLLYIGYAVTIACISLTLLIYVIIRKLRRKLLGLVVIGECVSLICFHIIFICVLTVDRWTSNPETEVQLCKALLVGLHYSTLSSASFITMHGICLYLAFVKHLRIDSLSYIRKATLWTQGFPAAVVAMSSIGAEDTYLATDRCFFGVWFLLGAVLPVAALLFFVTLYLLITIHFLSTPDPLRGKINYDQGLWLMIRAPVWITISDFALLCLSFTFGYLYALSPTLYKEWVLVSYLVFQGVIFVVLHCIVPLNVRKEIKRLLWLGRRRQGKELEKQRSLQNNSRWQFKPEIRKVHLGDQDATQESNSSFDSLVSVSNGADGSPSQNMSATLTGKVSSTSSGEAEGLSNIHTGSESEACGHSAEDTHFSEEEESSTADHCQVMSKDDAYYITNANSDLVEISFTRRGHGTSSNPKGTSKSSRRKKKNRLRLEERNPFGRSCMCTKRHDLSRPSDIQKYFGGSEKYYLKSTSLSGTTELSDRSIKTTKLSKHLDYLRKKQKDVEDEKRPFRRSCLCTRPDHFQINSHGFKISCGSKGTKVPYYITRDRVGLGRDFGPGIAGRVCHSSLISSSSDCKSNGLQKESPDEINLMFSNDCSITIDSNEELTVVSVV
ncbi:uncharacterized protein LOC121424231 [Lytechinus variegatus]|uniref:uncharacterized protein LOC121424231 n=1 Tax=Lytechinus variegatus TaxID=7654 RepID=UPI001BB222A7|nr:uncharacterized protein LOC121424231 [Lytechinus variegatus]